MMSEMTFRTAASSIQDSLSSSLQGSLRSFQGAVVGFSSFQRSKCAHISADMLSNAKRWRLRWRLRASLSIEEPATFNQASEHKFTEGPLSGDLAEIEALCRIQRLAEELHKAVMRCLRSLGSDVSDDSHTGEGNALTSSSLEERVVAGLACVGVTIQEGRMEILGGWVRNSDAERKRHPQLARFREKLRTCLKSLRVSLQSLVVEEGEENLAVYKTLQMLNNVCLDAGFPRQGSAPAFGDIPNFAAVRLEQASEAVSFWRGGQPTEDGLKWLIDNDFKIIVDLRAEEPENRLIESAVVGAEEQGKIRRVRIPVPLQTAPTLEQVMHFAKIILEAGNQRIFMHSYAGIVRASAMISRWREFVLRGGLKCIQDEDDGNEEGCDVDDLWPEEPLEEVVKVDVKDRALSEVEAANFHQLETIRPFNAQLPGPDIFSRKAMSQFFRSRKKSPSTILRNRLVRPSLYAERTGSASPKWSDALEHATPIPTSSNGGLVQSTSVDHVVVGNDMCATKTGVVRLQSRKKAEMYLVRTDGHSCTRERVMESTLAFTHPSTQQQMLMWKTPPKTVLLLKKLGDELMEEAKEVASFLHHKEGINVMVEPEVHDQFAREQGFGFIQTFYSHDVSTLHERVDFVVCLGGDGVILHASNLFKSSVPPVVSFNLGSLGFLTAHPFEDYKHDLRAIIRGNERIEGVYVTLRMRLRCEIFRDGQPIPGKVFEVLNEVVVDRGSNPYLCKIECYERNRLITKVQADGLLVATPTGSTAYSTAAGGSMVHPNVPCMLFTPICPHSLSFRPVILPDSAILELKVPNDSRSSAWVSFDGKKRQQLLKGDSVCIVMSRTPMPTVNKSDQTSDWFRSLNRCFNWSERREQRALISL